MIDHVQEPPLNFKSGHSELKSHASSALVLTGQRITALEVLAEDLGPKIGFAYFDLPRLSMYSVEAEASRLTTWLTLVQSHLSAARRALSDHGTVVAHIDDEGAPYVRAILDDLFGPDSHVGTVLWQKKYGPQNDLRGRIDDAHDFIFVYRPDDNSGTKSSSTYFWAHSYAGKTEDATREVEKLRTKQIISLASIPKTSKPEQLLVRLLDTFDEGTGLVLEVFSDTGFAAAAALGKGRGVVLLVGDTKQERLYLTECMKGRLVHAMKSKVVGTPGAKAKVVTLDVSPLPVKGSRVKTAGSQVHYGPSTPDIARESRTAEIVSRLTSVSIVNGGKGTLTDGFPSTSIRGELVETLYAAEPVLRGTCDGLFLNVAPLPKHEPNEMAAWAATLRDSTEAAMRVLSANGFIALHVTEKTYAASRLVAGQQIGRQRYVGTVVIAGGAKPDQGTDGEYWVIFRPMMEATPKKIGVQVDRSYENPDGDPRGPWRDPGHKGARSGGANTAFTYRYPPYRWQIVKGQLPPGTWRLNPISGVIWGDRLTKAGTYRFVARVTDSAGQSSDATCEIVVTETGEPEEVEEVWWIDRPPKSGGRPKITVSELPSGVVGLPYHAVLVATGGKPHEGSTIPGKAASAGKRTRYWEFAKDTLAQAILNDEAILGPTPEAKPRLKRRPDTSGRWSVTVELSWWDDQRLSGETPLQRLLRILTRSGSLVICGADDARGLSKVDRRVLAIGSSHVKDINLHAELSPPVGAYDIETRLLDLIYTTEDFAAKLAWLEGFFPAAAMRFDGEPHGLKMLTGAAVGCREACVILSPSEWPTRQLCADIAAVLQPRFAKIVVYYYRGTPTRTSPALEFRRIPFDLTCRPQR